MMHGRPHRPARLTTCPRPADGGRPPHDIWPAVLDPEEFVEDGACGSMRIHRRV
jgi:hypothetical protein